MTRAASPTFYVIVGALVAWWLATALAFATLPTAMPTPFDLPGAADSPLQAKGPWWLGVPAIASLLFLVSEVALRKSLDHPDLVNLPNKANFLSMSADERAPVMQALRAVLHLVLLSSFVVLAAVQVAMYHTPQRGAAALPSWVTPVVIITALVANGVLVMRSYRRVSALTTSRPAASPR